MDKYRNIVLEERGESLSYRPINNRGSEPNYPKRTSRKEHGERIKKEFEEAWLRAEKNQIDRAIVAVQTRDGVYLDIKGKPGYDLISKSLEDTRQKMRLLTVTKDPHGAIRATIFIPKHKKDVLLKKINKYKDSASGSDMVGTIESINEALVESLWVSGKDLPIDEKQWCEVWLLNDANNHTDEVYNSFIEFCITQNIEYKQQRIVFPERIVVGVKANKADLAVILLACSNIAEFREMASSTSFFINLPYSEQREWIKELSSRIDLSEQSNTSVCLIDTGVNNGHPLLSKVLFDEDMHTIHPEKGVNDSANHGTRMAGIAEYFNLEDKLDSLDTIKVHHFLESVKLLDNAHDNERDLYGDCTAQAISLAEITKPDTNRVICMAVTTDDEKAKDGRPSSWSGAIDSLVAGAEEKGIKRLILVSAGNTSVEEIIDTKDFVSAVINHPIDDPGQAWNAITVGAYTEKDDIKEEKLDGYMAIAKSGGFSPFTASSLTWDKKWPIKPEIVLEGGNLAYSEMDDFYTETEDLALLTTGNEYLKNRPFDTISMTSSATAQASWMAASIRYYYPDLWPETVRALMIHSSSWTETMIENVAKGNKELTKKQYRELLQICGYGVPNLNKAIWCADNSVNLIIEDELQPYMKKKDGSIVSNEMHIHTLPWPSDLLLGYGDTSVKMRITLSYFIEPGPGEIGWKDKYRYPSCGLAFDVNNETENREEFTKRISKAMREENENPDDFSNDSGRWTIGAQTRSRGSIHSDIWDGTAGQLSNSNMIIVYPKTGWWKTRTNLKKYNSKIRYSLVVTIETPEVEMDLYSAIQTKIKNRTAIKTEITAIR